VTQGLWLTKSGFVVNCEVILPEVITCIDDKQRLIECRELTDIIQKAIGRGLVTPVDTGIAAGNAQERRWEP
jgi:hypothetical protein